MSIQEATFVYPDEYIVEQDQLGISAAQTTAVRHAVNVLEPIYEEKYNLETAPTSSAPAWIATELNHYHRAIENSQNLIVPDIAVFEGLNVPLVLQKTLPSWDMRLPDYPPPPLVIEICSRETYDGDIVLHNKPRLYGLIGVREYFAYDPNSPRVWPERGPKRVEGGKRLLGWRYDQAGRREEIEPASEPGRRGWLWSEVLGHWLVPNEGLLEFYTREGVRRLDRGELARQAREEARQEAQARQEAEQARQQAEQVAQREVTARQEAEQRETQARQETKQLSLRVQQEAAQAAQRQAQTDQQLADLQRQLEEMRRRLGEK